MLLRDAGVPGDLEAWVTGAEQALLAALDARGEATASELAGDDPRLAPAGGSRGRVEVAGTQNVASRLLLIMATDGQVIHGRPRGSWLSQGYRWTTAHAWCPGGFAEWDHEAAEAELARCWLAAFGPAPGADLQWWAGWDETQTRRALATIGPAEVELEDGGPGYVCAGQRGPAPAAEPWAALLPGLDTTPMGWQDRTWFLGSTGRGCSTRPTSGRRCGGTAGSWAAGRRPRTGRSSAGSSRTPGPRRSPPRARPRPGWPH